MIFFKLAAATQSICRTGARTDEHSGVELLVVQKGTDHAFLVSGSIYLFRRNSPCEG
jgi:hypothetical protein